MERLAPWSVGLMVDHASARPMPRMTTKISAGRELGLRILYRSFTAAVVSDHRELFAGLAMSIQRNTKKVTARVATTHKVCVTGLRNTRSGQGQVTAVRWRGRRPAAP